MPKKLDYYELSADADIDLDEIFDYSEQKYGFNQAVKYLTYLDDIFQTLLINYEIGRTRNEIKQGLYSIYEQEHIVFYRILNNYIRIVKSTSRKYRYTKTL